MDAQSAACAALTDRASRLVEAPERKLASEYFGYRLIAGEVKSGEPLWAAEVSVLETARHCILGNFPRYFREPAATKSH